MFKLFRFSIKEMINLLLKELDLYHFQFIIFNLFKGKS